MQPCSYSTSVQTRGGGNTRAHTLICAHVHKSRAAHSCSMTVIDQARQRQGLHAQHARTPHAHTTRTTRAHTTRTTRTTRANTKRKTRANTTREMCTGILCTTQHVTHTHKICTQVDARTHKHTHTHKRTHTHINARNDNEAIRMRAYSITQCYTHTHTHTRIYVGLWRAHTLRTHTCTPHLTRTRAAVFLLY
jgi:hypothetical protein